MDGPSKIEADRIEADNRGWFREERASLSGLGIGNYRVEAKIGEGGMGAVHVAVHRVTQRRIAVKFLRPESASDGESAATRTRRFHDEARALAEVRHPNLVEYLDSGDLPDGQVYIMMELLDGSTLREFIVSQGGKLAPDLAKDFIHQIASALAKIHEREIVHRDLNPRNLMVLSDPSTRLGWRIKILDFGLAKFLNQNESLTRTHSQMGTLRYMSPEQCESAKSVDESTDLYSLGLIFFEMLTGESPYPVVDGSTTKWLDAHIRCSPRSLRSLWPEAPAILVRLVDEMMDKHPEYRPRAQEIVAYFETGVRIPERRSLLHSNHVLGFLFTSAMVPSLPSISFTLLHKPPPRSATLTQPEIADGAANAPDGMALIPPLRLFMGASSDEMRRAQQECSSRNGPWNCDWELIVRERTRQLVSVRPFYIDRTEVTNAQFVRVINSMKQELDLKLVDGYLPRQISIVDSDGQRHVMFDRWYQGGRGSGLEVRRGVLSVRPGFENSPVVQVTYEAARRVCQKRGGDLPTEVQWEAAARGTDGRRYPWGDFNPQCDGVIFDRVPGGRCERGGPMQPVPVGTAEQDVSPYGIHDMAGNVMEWVRDPFVSLYPRCISCIDPTYPSNGKERAEHSAFSIRGGSYFHSSEVGRVTSRSMAIGNEMSQNLGFRCAIPATLVAEE